MEALASQCWLMENQLVYVSVLVACARMMDDPLYPLLSVLVMETLSCSLSRTVGGGFIIDLKTGGRGGKRVEFLHLFISDDSLLL